uniref:Retrovirus-related Pol polyprotein from transposon 412 family n=1 Tax=Cajanus cajan TaxID=3821 RepID=A0A151SZN6_CAJCA|nr:Retrovirus-related Pol polyprotein from transposon 412 family [Cajanus cajan]
MEACHILLGRPWQFDKKFYRRFVPNFSSIASLFNELVKKDVLFEWTTKHDQAFQLLKDQLTNAHILALPNFEKTFKLECDALLNAQSTHTSTNITIHL